MMASEVFNEAVVKKLNEIVQKKYATSNAKFLVEKATNKGDNYLGLVYRVTVILSNETERDKKIYLLVKIPPQNLFRRNQFFARPSFLREALAYEEFLPLIEEYQRHKGMDETQVFDNYPKCYATMTENMQEAIFLQDLCVQNFKLHDRFKALDFSHVNLVMQGYGKLHALSLVLKREKPLAMATFKSLPDVLAQRNDMQMLIYYEELIKRAASALNADSDLIYKKKLQDYFKAHKFHDLLAQLVDGNKAEPYAVVCHGDCWNNNILFQYEKDEPVKMCLLDWQIMRYASPITDIMYFLFTTTIAEFRNKYYQQALSTYYSALELHLQGLGFAVDDLYPRAQFELDLKNFGAVGLLFAMIVLPLVTTAAEDVPNLDELGKLIESGGTINDLNNSSFLDGGKSKLYNERMRGVIIDIIDLKYI